MRDQNIEWLNRNANIAYPLAADCDERDTSGEFHIPREFIVGLGLSIHAGHTVDPANYHISSILVSAVGATIVVGYTVSGTLTPVATCAIPFGGFERNGAYGFSGMGEFTDTTGYVVIGDITALQQQPAGAWTFGLDNARLEVQCIHPMIRGVSSIRVRNGTDVSPRITGDITLRAGTNVRITPIIASGHDPVFVFDAINGAGLNNDCVCRNTNQQPIYTINSVAPNNAGELSILGSSCMNISGATHGLVFHNTCAEPCCGWEQGDVLTTTLDTLRQQLATLDTFVTTLQSRTVEFEHTVMGSKLGDRGCADS